MKFENFEPLNAKKVFGTLKGRRMKRLDGAEPRSPEFDFRHQPLAAQLPCPVDMKISDSRVREGSS